MGIAVFVAIGWIVSLCMHDFGHAIAAYWGGDTSVKEKGYLTLNPLKYTDPGLSLALPLMFLLLGGIALPGGAVYINQQKLRSRAWKSAVSAAGPFMSAIAAIVLAIPLGLGILPPPGDMELQPNAIGELTPVLEQGWVWPALSFLVAIEVYSVVLNLLPIPPLDGYGILEPWLPDRVRVKLLPLRRYGILVLFGALWFIPAVGRALWSVSSVGSQWLGIDPIQVWAGYSLFRAQAPVVMVIAIVGIIFYQRVLKQQKSTTSHSNRNRQAPRASDQGEENAPGNEN
jgi:Zn-dependent protease